MKKNKRSRAPFKDTAINMVWENGYTMALVDNKHKKYTTIDLLKAFYAGIDAETNHGVNFETFIKNLKK